MSIKPFFLCIVYAVAFALIANNYAHAQESTETTQRRFSPEIGALAEAQLWYTSIELTGNVLTPRNNVFGINVGRSMFTYNDDCVDEYTLKFCLHYRHYFPFGKRKRVAFYPDIIMGTEYVYKMVIAVDTEIDDDDYLGKGNFGPMGTVRAGFAFNLKHDSRLFLGLSFVPTLGVHIGYVL